MTKKNAAKKMVLEALQATNLPDSTILNFQNSIKTLVDMSVNDLTIDSLAMMEFCIHLEINSGVFITPNELENCRLISDLLSAIENQIS